MLLIAWVSQVRYSELTQKCFRWGRIQEHCISIQTGLLHLDLKPVDNCQCTSYTQGIRVQPHVGLWFEFKHENSMTTGPVPGVNLKSSADLTETTWNGISGLNFHEGTYMMLGFTHSSTRLLVALLLLLKFATVVCPVVPVLLVAN